jgi:uncharacterized membrane protein YraQ (UPF0718 family)
MATAGTLIHRGRPVLRGWVTIPLLLSTLLVLLRLLGLEGQASLRTFAVVFTAIAVEALPFVLLGAAVSAVLEVYVSGRVFEWMGRFPVALQIPAAAVGGFAFPVCECGSVPVARRLIARGVHPAAGLAFMIASPIFNPIVLGSTWVAYGSRGLGLEMVAGRAGLGLLLALLVGWALGTEGAREMLRPRSGDSDHGGHEPASACCAPKFSKRRAFTSHLTEDFFFMGKFLILGAAIAAAVQSLVPQTIVGTAAASPISATLTLMGLAFLSSLCSEADAFVAVSFSPFPLGSQLAFLVLGPVLDFKLVILYAGTFRGRMLASLTAIAVPVILAGALWFEVMAA